MNGSTAQARVIVDELVRNGVADAVLCPGSRNAPLAFALARAETLGLLRLHVRIDERTAGFLALGLALASGRPVPVAVTSGTAVANLHPAVLEASHSGVPLLVLAADRPPELVGTGASQTIEQTGLFGGAVRRSAVLATPPPHATDADAQRWRAALVRVLAAATGAGAGGPGPVQLDLPYAEPLVPDDGPPVPGSGPAGLLGGAVAPGRDDGGPWTAVAPPVPTPAPLPLDPAAPTWSSPAAGTGRGPGAARRGPAGGGADLAVVGARAARGTLVAGSRGAAPRPGRRPRTSHTAPCPRPAARRPGRRGVRRPRSGRHPVDRRPRHRPRGRGPARPGPAAGLHRGLGGRRPGRGCGARPGARRRRHGRRPGLALARAVVAAQPDGGQLVLGSSNPVRDVALAAAPRTGLTVRSNRGVAGIDGTVSTAVGATLAHRDGPTALLLGDLTLLHDTTGMLAGPAEPVPDLTAVVLDDDGGGIFSLLEQGADEHAHAFERVFGTPVGADLLGLARAAGWSAADWSGDPTELAARPGSGRRLVRVAATRDGLRDTHAALRAAVAAALDG
ncbi:thiamine pyrophosphate-binding protein [Pseudonocardia alni]|uniref:thiamine pyrophosphate-binding protein n=1 Tax=Pseudonocardia alni TaxID=33907 RepID=UPI00386DF079